MRDQFTHAAIVLDNALAYWIHRVYQATRNESFRAFREAGEGELTPEQWIVLVRLWEHDGRTQTELGESTYRDRPTMSRILDVMEKRGLVERRAHESNARAFRIHLTARGRELRKALVPAARALVKKQLRGISEADLLVTRSTLQRIFDNLTEG